MDKKIIETLQLEPLMGEGGYFRRTYESDKKINIAGDERSIATAIYYYLDSSDFSAWHTVKCDEMWHFYAGSELSLHLINQQGELSSVRLGNINEDSALTPQFLVPANTLMAAEVNAENTFALIGATCFPGFDYRDFKVWERAELLKLFPQHETIIKRLTRE